MLVASCLGFLALTILAPPPQRTAAPPAIRWHGSYERAFDEANERGVPLLLVIIQDGEEANEDVFARIIRSKPFVAATTHTVNLVASRGTEEDHGRLEVEKGGHVDTVCGRFGSHPCLSHQRAEAEIFRDFAKDGLLRTPAVILALPDQTVVKALFDRNRPEDYLAAFDAAIARLPNGLDEAEADEVRHDLEEAHAWLDAGEIQRVVSFTRKFADRESEAGLIHKVKKLRGEVERRGAAQLEDVEAKIEAKAYGEAIGALERLQREYRDTPAGDRAGRRRAELQRDRDVRAALAREKREANARSLLENADRLVGQGQLERAEQLFADLLARFGDTEAARTLRERRNSED